MGIVIKDRGYDTWLKSLIGPIPKLYTGVFGEKAEQDHGEGITTGELAVVHEFGRGNVPERSFVRSWWDENEEAVRRQVYEETKDIPAAFVDWKKVLEAVGTFAIAGMAEKMTDIPPPLAPSTIARKGHEQTLVETGQLREALTFRVGPKKAEDE